MLSLNINGPLSLKRKENGLNNTDKRSTFDHPKPGRIQKPLIASLVACTAVSYKNQSRGHSELDVSRKIQLFTDFGKHWYLLK
jgi:hypothetical protein